MLPSVHVSGPGPPSHTTPTKLAVPSTSRNQLRDTEPRKEKKIGHRRVTEEGTVTYKKKPTSELQGAIQLGIQHHIGSLQQKPDRDLLYGDFNIIDTVNFPHEGTKTTQAHPYSDFRFRIYAPVAFRCFRKSYKLDIRDFLNSLCSQSLQELSNPGASGSIFYISQDDEFIIKTVQHKEGEFLQKLLPEYFMNLMQHPRTLLPKYYGLYCYQSGHKNIRFVVMNNLLPSSVRIHEKYDLKGSTYGRQASEAERAKTSPTLKDLDFISNHPDGIWLEAETYDALLKTIERDCLVLKSFRIMDYSLLLGIHNLDQAKRERLAQKHASVKENTVNQYGDDTTDLSPNSVPKMKSNGLISHISNKSGENTATLRSSSVSNGVGNNESSNKTSPSSLNGSNLTTTISTARHTHFKPGADGEQVTPSNQTKTPSDNDEVGEDKSAFQRGVHKSHSQKRVVAYCTAMESIKASSEPVDLESEERELIPSGGIPARDTNGDRLLLYIGIIDILQSYRILKKMEHGFKSLVVDGKTISVTHPLYYAQRFQEFLGRTVFKRIQSLDEPNIFGPHTSRFRKYVHMAQAAVALKQGTSKRIHRPMAAIKSLDDQIGTVQLKRSSTIRRFMISALRNTMCGTRPKPKVVMGHIQEKARILVHHQNSLIQLEVKWDPMPPLACQSQKYRTGTVVRANSIEGSSPPTPPYLPCRLTMVKDQSQEIITVEGLDHNLDTDLMY
ncbi:Phosphatidylinositol 4-phosphate 5-kinase type-1 alpha [Schistosoma japonicum]|nr:Phosphatidylinositol 4-phosphate 5-kinase type-1 alpha [Schistosoma japonicum]